MFALSLASAVLLGAFVVRRLLPPPVPHRVGHRTWILPQWPERRLARITIDAPETSSARCARRSSRPPEYAGPVIAHDLRTLSALTARLVPGPPEDPDPGALEAGAAEAIDLLLGAFACEQPPIHAALEGGFVPLDPVAELGWRIRLEGSQGLPEREFAGPVKGLAQLLSDGLALLDRRSREAHGVDFADAPTADQDALLDAPDEQLGAFVRLALTLTLEAVYGPPQYGGNRDGAGWKPLGWAGFTQPQGFTPAQVSEPDGGATGSREAVSELRSSLPGEAGWRSDSN